MASFVARLRTSLPKPEALADVPDATIAIHATEWIDKVSSALGDKATLPLIQWDASLDGTARALAARAVYNSRGRNRQAGADSGIDKMADDAEAYLSRCKPGAPLGKSENPRFVDSRGNRVIDAPRVISSARSDDFARRRRRCC